MEVSCDVRKRVKRTACENMMLVDTYVSQAEFVVENAYPRILEEVRYLVYSHPQVPPLEVQSEEEDR